MEEIKTPENFISFCESVEMADIPEAFNQLGDDLKENSIVQDFVLEKNGLSFQYFNDRYKRDKEYILNKIGLSTEAALMLKFVDESLIGDEELLKASCKVSMSAHKWLDDDKWNKNSEWYKKIAAYNYGTIHFMPVEIKSSVEMCKAFLEIDMRSFNMFSDEMKANRAVQEYALKKDGYVFNIFPDRFKCDKNYIKKMLSDCWDKSDARSYMIFAVCDELQNDQELINLAIERNRFVFEEMFPKDKWSKELFEEYLKVNPHIFKYVPEELKNDRDLIKSILSGGYNDAARKNYFKQSSFYEDLEFAREVAAESSYPFVYRYLKPEFKADHKVITNALANSPKVLSSISKEHITPEMNDLIRKAESDLEKLLIDEQKSNPLYSKEELQAKEAFQLFNMHRKSLIGKTVEVRLDEATVDFKWFGTLVMEDGDEVDGYFEGSSNEEVVLTYRIDENNLDSFFKELTGLIKVGTRFFHNADDIDMEMENYELFADRFFDQDENHIDTSGLESDFWSENWTEGDMEVLENENGILINNMPIVINPFE